MLLFIGVTFLHNLPWSPLNQPSFPSQEWKRVRPNEDVLHPFPCPFLSLVLLLLLLLVVLVVVVVAVVVVVSLQVFLVSQVTQHGNTNWLHGAMLVTTYVRRLMGGRRWVEDIIGNETQRKTYKSRALGMKLYLCFLSKTAGMLRGLSLHKYRFRCVLGRAGAVLGRNRVPGNQFREPGPGFDGFRQVLRFQETGFQTPRFRVQKEPGSGNPRH